MTTRSLRGMLFSLVCLTAVRGAALAAPAWENAGRPNRMALDSRADDSQPGKTVELFLDSERFAAAAHLEKFGEKFGADAVTFVAEKADGSQEELAFAAREEIGQFNREGIVFRMIPPAGTTKLWMYFGGKSAAATPLPTQWNLFGEAFDSAAAGQWHSSDKSVAITADDGHALQIAFDDQHEVNKAPLTVEVTRSFKVPAEYRGMDAMAAFDLKASAQGFVPVAILLQQFDEGGKKLTSCAVDPRWLTMCAANGQDVRLRERGFIDAATASISVTMQLWCRQNHDGIMNNDGSWLKYPDSDSFKLEISKAELRAGHAISFPGFEKSLYAAGFSGAGDDLALIAKDNGFCFDANPPAVWSEGAKPTDAASYHWPCGAGTLECWVMPEWNAKDGGKREIVDALAGIAAAQGVLEIFYTPDDGKIHVNRADLSGQKSGEEAAADLAPGKWHHIAYTWDPAAKREELFVDGRRVMSHHGGFVTAIDLKNDSSAKNVPGRIWLGQSRQVNHNGHDALNGRLDEFRVSDGVRYTADFTPAHAPFVVDPATRALFHFDGRLDGTHDGDDGRISATLVSATPQTASEFSYEVRGGESVVAKWVDTSMPDAENPQKLFAVKPYPPMTQAGFSTAYTQRCTTLHLKPGDSANIHCDGEPRMGWVELRCPEDGTALAAPLLAKVGEADARSLPRLISSLNLQGKSSKEKADTIFKYLVSFTNYFWTITSEIEPDGSLIDPGNCSTIFLNSYLQFGCGNQNTLVRNAFLEAGMSADMTHGSAHLYEQVFYDGSWHLYDLTPRLFCPSRDGTRAASLAEIERDPYLMVRASGGDPNINYWLASDTRKYNLSDRALALPDMSYRLRPGEAFRYHWDNAGRYNPALGYGTEHSATWKDAPLFRGKPLSWATHFPPYFANGVFSVSCTPREGQPALSDWHDGAFVYKFLSPYVVCGAVVSAAADHGAAMVEVSFDEGKKWTAAPAATDGVINLERLCADRHLYWLRVTPAAGGKVTRFDHQAVVMMNPKVLTPALTKGDNAIRLTADSGSATEVTLHYEEQSDAALEIDGGARFGWVSGNERQLLVGEPGKLLAFDVKQCPSRPDIICAAGIKSNIVQGGDKWRVALDVPASLHDGLYELTVKAGDRSRSAALLVCQNACLVPAEIANRQGRAALAQDPDGVHGQVLSLHSGGTGGFPLQGISNTPLAVFALARISHDVEGNASLLTAAGAEPIIKPNFAHIYWEQDYLQYQWRWFHVRVGSYPCETVAAVRLPEQGAATLRGVKGETLVDSLLVMPVTNERLVEAVTQYLFSANYEPWHFQRDWGPITVGVPYVVK